MNDTNDKIFTKFFNTIDIVGDGHIDQIIQFIEWLEQKDYMIKKTDGSGV